LSASKILVRGSLLATVLGLVLISHSAAAENGRAAADYEALSLSYNERARGHRIVDVDADNKLDLLWVFERKTPPRTDPLYGLRSCTFAPAPHFTNCHDLELAPDVRAYDVAEVDGTAGAELLLITASGAKLHSFGKSGFGAARPLSLDTLLSATDPGPPISIRAFFDLDSDGQSELVVPTVVGPTLLRFTNGTASAPQTLSSPATVKYKLGRQAHELGRAVGRSPARGIITEAISPALFVEDFDGDERLDIITTVETRIRVFAQRADGSFARTPTHDIEVSVVTEEEEASGFTGEAASFGDLNGDGLADIIVLKWGSSEERTRMDRHIFFARDGLNYSDTADQVIRSESFFPDFEIRDLNGDGRRDLVIPYFHIAPAQAFKVLTQNSLRVQLRLFLMREDGRFAQDEGKTFAKVDRRIVLDYKLNVIRLIFGSGRPPDSFAPLLTLQGDFDNDGRADLASDSGDDELHLRFGNASSEYSKSEDLAIPFESSLAYELIDINGDGRSDVVSYYGRESRSGDSGADAARRELRRNSRSKPPAQAAPDNDAPLHESRIQILLSR
jgi:hypothetical protein